MSEHKETTQEFAKCSLCGRSQKYIQIYSTHNGILVCDACLNAKKLVAEDIEKNGRVKEIGNYPSRPIDYFFIIDSFLSSGTIRNEIDLGKIIYGIAKCYIPEKLYKFYSLSDNEELNNRKLQTLEGSKVFMSPASCLNDPFDTKAIFYRPELLMDFGNLRAYNGKILDDISKGIVLSSFTENDENNAKMWADYSNNHKGFCVRYSTDRIINPELHMALFPVQYTQERKDITSILAIVIENSMKQNRVLKEDMVFLSYICLFQSCIKHESWNTEKEFRITWHEKSGNICPAVPESIYIGINCEHKDRLLAIGKKLNVDVYQMRFDEFSGNYQFQKELVYKQEGKNV